MVSIVCYDIKRFSFIRKLIIEMYISINNNFFKYGTMNENWDLIQNSRRYIITFVFFFPSIFFIYISRQINHLTYHESKFFHLDSKLYFCYISRKKYYIYNFIYDIYIAYKWEITKNISIYWLYILIQKIRKKARTIIYISSNFER